MPRITAFATSLPVLLLARAIDGATAIGPLDQAGFQYQWTHPDERMDQLHQAVSAIVEADAKEEEDAMVTFDRIRAITDKIAGRHAESATRSRASRPDRPKPV
jgi:hypothetical protein